MVIALWQCLITTQSSNWTTPPTTMTATVAPRGGCTRGYVILEVEGVSGPPLLGGMWPDMWDTCARAHKHSHITHMWETPAAVMKNTCLCHLKHTLMPLETHVYATWNTRYICYHVKHMFIPLETRGNATTWYTCLCHVLFSFENHGILFILSEKHAKHPI